jgi:transposase
MLRTSQSPKTLYAILEKLGTERFFKMDLNQRGAPRLKFELRGKEIEKACKLDGKYILETSNFELTSIEIAQAYLDRDVVEKFFQALEDVVELRPIVSIPNDTSKPMSSFVPLQFSSYPCSERFSKKKART